MCLTIPKKVLEISENGVLVETHTGDRQLLKSMIGLTVGEYVFSQQNLIIEKIDNQTAVEILNLIRNEEARHA